MVRIWRKYMQFWPVVGAIVFLAIQVACDLYLPTVTATLVDKGIVGRNLQLVWRMGFLMLGVALIGVVMAAGNVYFGATQGMHVGQMLRRAIYHKVLRFSSADMNEFGESSLITRSTNDVVQVQNASLMLLRMILMSPLMLIGASIMAYSREPRLTRIFMVSLPVLVVLVAILMVVTVPLFKSIQFKTDRINLIFREGLTGVRVIRAFNQDDREQNRFDVANKDYTNTGFKAYTLVSMAFPIMTLVLSMTNVAIIWFGARLIADRTMLVGNLIAFMTYANQILFSFMMLAMVFVFLPRASASATRINAVLDTKNRVADPEPADREQLDPHAPASMSFEHVNAKYEGADHLALADLNFNVKAGQTLAIIGGTGSGKSTLVNLIPRLQNVSGGRIVINGKDISKLTQHDLHSLISITQQKAVLFTGTVRSNMQFGKPDATDDEIWHALKIAQADDFIKEQGGLDAPVEQDGSNYSGGQRQRLAIARTLIKPASVYIFDDSFSALDFKTDAKLREALHQDDQVQQAVTVIVAQRISTVADADLILVLDDGKVVGQGTHEELKANNKYYQEILHSQIQEGDDKRAKQ